MSVQFTLEMCATAKNCKEKYNTYLGGSRTFKVFVVNTVKKLITSACYDKQYVYVYLKLFSC